jgi:hypothetical protein
MALDQDAVAQRRRLRHHDATNDAQHGQRRHRFDQSRSAHGKKIVPARRSRVTTKARAWYPNARARATGCVDASLLTTALITFSDLEPPSGARGITSSI